ncbi:hypothetical protein J4E85_004566 [Alternaria conjuncta]|uniref:uncharacterized protein n=1 Tax=Alternaria conjuncta TaxID=181017 RepID=UPI00221F2C61|nr:uncharacterized protein J4E85_004566 [Alternaria conjuncta]KAI4929945.1 hypothetical protein J4E85_004566 [Alternaria conjuncta]
MLLNAQTLALAAFFSTLATGRPLDSSKPREIVPRNKSYSVVNVGGDASTPVATATSVIKTTKTVEVVGPAQTVTQEVTATVVEPQPAPASTSSCSSSIETPKPIFVTVTLSPDNGPTEYYDDGMWHTHYRVKTFEAAAAVTAAP